MKATFYVMQLKNVISFLITKIIYPHNPSIKVKNKSNPIHKPTRTPLPQSECCEITVNSWLISQFAHTHIYSYTETTTYTCIPKHICIHIILLHFAKTVIVDCCTICFSLRNSDCECLYVLVDVNLLLMAV